MSETQSIAGSSASFVPSEALKDALKSVCEFHEVAGDYESYAGDWTKVHSRHASGVLFPRSTEEVSAIVKLCADAEFPLVPSGGRTGLAGGAVATRGEFVVSLDRLNWLGVVDELGLTLTAGAGAITEAVHEHCQAHGLTWPVDFASKGSSQIGGNVATNAGGVRVIRYGLTREWVLGMRVVTGTGEILDLDLALEKNNTGIDLKQCFIGTEGTLGIITELTLKLAPLPGPSQVFLFSLENLAAVLQLFRLARRGPFALSAFEMMSNQCLARLKQHRGVEAPLEVAEYYVLMEVEAWGDEKLMDWLEQALGVAEDGVLAQGAEQARALWTLREGISESLSATGLPHKNDISLPIAHLETFAAELGSLFTARYPRYEVNLFGHIGDGNLHVNVMKPDDMTKAEFLAETRDADRALFELVRKYDGSISAEHGIGLLKKEWLTMMRSNEELALMRKLKGVFDPKGILNPGKIL